MVNILGENMVGDMYPVLRSGMRQLWNQVYTDSCASAGYGRLPDTQSALGKCVSHKGMG